MTGPDDRVTPDDAPVRIVVQRDPTRARGLRPVRELAERTTVGDAYLDSLIRTQFTLGMRFLAAVVVALGGVPVAFWLEPRLRTVRFAGIPIAWIIVGVAFYPMLLLMAWLFLRRVERNETDFVELVTGNRAERIEP